MALSVSWEPPNCLALLHTYAPEKDDCADPCRIYPLWGRPVMLSMPWMSSWGQGLLPLPWICGRRLRLRGVNWSGASKLAPLRRFAAMLRRHRQSICNYADHPITTARLEGGHVAIGLIRKRARGLLDTRYFKLKIRQSAMAEPPLGLYALNG